MLFQAFAPARIVRRQRQGRIRPALARGGEIEQQRRKGMAVGRRRQFDLPARLQRPVARHQGGEGAADVGEQPLAVVGREAFALGHQFGEQRLAAALGFAAPGEVVPGQQVGAIGAGQVGERGRPFAHQRLVQLQQPPEAGKRLDHRRPVAAEAAVQEQRALRGGQVVEAGALQQAQQGVAEHAGLELAHVVVDLIEQHRHEIDHRAHARMALEMRRHVGVVLERVQVGPRQREAAAGTIAVIRLVHVPEEDQIEPRRSHGARKGQPFSGCGGSAGRAFPA